MSRVMRWVADWPWTQTFVAVTLALATLYVVAPFVTAATVIPSPTDEAMDDVRELLTIMLPSAVAFAVGKRATTKVEVLEFDARQQAPEGP